MAINAETEFEDTEVVEEKVVEKPAPAGATKEELAEVTEKLKGLEGLRNDAEIIRKLKEVFGGEPVSEKDAMLRKEIKRLVPELDDLDKIKALMPMIVDTLEGSAEERLQTRTNGAQEHMKALMPEIGLDPNDAEAVGYLEEALAREIKSNKEALGLWARGNVKSAVNKAFEKVQAKLFAPVRARAKVGAVRTITESPRATPRGGAPTAGSTAGKPKLDFKDSSRASIGKIHDAAFDRLQELVNE